MVISNFFNKNTVPVVIALGYFDCLHIGHMQLIKKACEKAKQLGVESAVFTFSNNPGSLLPSKNRLVNTFEERLKMFEEAGIDRVVYAEFTKQFMSITSDEFLNMLKTQNVVGVVCGFDYTFGKNSAGDTKVLRQFCEANNMSFDEVAMVGFEGQKASATLIKKLLTDGDMQKVTACLGHKYFVSGKVVHGYGIGGSKLFPTANLDVSDDKLFPKKGVYAGETVIEGKKYVCVINVGTRPTFNDDCVKIEAHIVDFSGNLYGKDITVYFNEFLRDIKKFDDLNQLKNQISKDIEDAKCVK